MSTTQTHVYLSARTLKAIGDWIMTIDNPDYLDGVTLVIDPYDGSITVVDAYNERCRKFDAWPGQGA